MNCNSGLKGRFPLAQVAALGLGRPSPHNWPTAIVNVALGNAQGEPQPEFWISSSAAAERHDKHCIFMGNDKGAALGLGHRPKMVLQARRVGSDSPG